jgi:hypothetical protein
MSAATRLDEARRWTKFPATLLFITGLLWLLVVFFRAIADFNGNIAQPAETLVGAVMVFVLAVVVPLGSLWAGGQMLNLNRRALYAGAVLPFFPLLYYSWHEALRIGAKFHEYRTLHIVNSFGTAVIEAVIVLGLWCVTVLHVLYIRRALRELAGAEAWAHGATPGGKARPAPAQPAAAAAGAPAVEADDSAGEDMCFLLPDTAEDEERE